MKEKATLLSQRGLYLCRQRPTLPHTFACSTIGPARLNLRRSEGVSARCLRAGASCRNPEPRPLRRRIPLTPSSGRAPSFNGCPQSPAGTMEKAILEVMELVPALIRPGEFVDVPPGTEGIS
jgi:hypothetical protein